MGRKLTRTILLVTIIAISTFVGGIFAVKIISPSFQVNNVVNSNLDNNEMNAAIPQNYSKRGLMEIDDACCGHTDTTPPTIQLYSHTNGATILGGTAIKIFIDDDNPFDDFKATEVLYHWNDEPDETLDETEEDFIYETVPPLVVGTHVLYIYAADRSENMASETFSFTITSDFDPPNIEFSAPNIGENFTGMYLFRVNVTDDVGILWVKMQIDTGASYEMSHKTTSSYYERSYNVSKFLVNGDHWLHVTVWDEDYIQHRITESINFTVYGALEEAIVSDPPEWDSSLSDLPENVSTYVKAGNLEDYVAESGEIDFKIAFKDDLEIASVDFTIYALDDYDPSTGEPDISDARVELIKSLTQSGSDEDWDIFEYTWKSTSAIDNYYLCEFKVQDTDEEANTLTITIILEVSNIGNRSSVDFGGPGFEVEIIILALSSLILITTLIKRKRGNKNH